MRVTYAVMTVNDPKVRRWFKTVDERLRTKKGVMISGRVKDIGEGWYVLSVDTAVDMIGFLLGPLMLMFAGVGAYVFWHTVTLSNWLVGIGLCAMVIVYTLITPTIHRLLMRLTLRRITGRWVSVKPVTQDALWRLAFGKV